MPPDSRSKSSRTASVSPTPPPRRTSRGCGSSTSRSAVRRPPRSISCAGRWRTASSRSPRATKGDRPVAAEAPTAILDNAWGHIPQTREATAGIGSFTRTRVERIISLVAGFGSLALGTQAFLIALGPPDEAPGWHEPLMIVVFAPLAVMILACLIGRGVRFTAGAFAFIYLAALGVWPFATTGTDVPTDEPWIWYLVNIATLAAVLAFPLPLQVVFTALTPLMFGLVFLIQGEFARDVWIPVGLDVSFALILGGVILALGWLFRSVAANVDETRARAVASYAA